MFPDRCQDCFLECFIQVAIMYYGCRSSFQCTVDMLHNTFSAQIACCVGLPKPTPRLIRCISLPRWQQADLPFLFPTAVTAGHPWRPAAPARRALTPELPPVQPGGLGGGGHAEELWPAAAPGPRSTLHPHTGAQPDQSPASGPSHCQGGHATMMVPSQCLELRLKLWLTS